jgi:hypothetical protein
VTWEAAEAHFAAHTDKFMNGYGPLYRELFEILPDTARILEIGVWQGGSMRLWKHLRPNGLIVGVDNLQDEGTVDALNCHFLQAGQADPDLAARVRELSPEGYDLVIDDASHLGSLSQRTFDNLWPVVVPGGWYVLEDWGVGVRGNLPYYGCYEGESMLQLAQSMLAQAGRAPWRGDADIAEFRGRASIIAVRKAGS